MTTKQHRFSLRRAVLAGVGFLFILAAPAQAQFTGSYQTNIISSVLSNWSGVDIAGSNSCSSSPKKLQERF